MSRSLWRSFNMFLQKKCVYTLHLEAVICGLLDDQITPVSPLSTLFSSRRSKQEKRSWNAWKMGTPIDDNVIEGLQHEDEEPGVSGERFVFCSALTWFCTFLFVTPFQFVIFGRDVSKIPCFRNSFLTGIYGGVGCGIASFLATSKCHNCFCAFNRTLYLSMTDITVNISIFVVHIAFLCLLQNKVWDIFYK